MASYRSYLRARDGFSDIIYSAFPSPPDVNDQKFLGNTTDNVTAPFQGEVTPFFASILPDQELVEHKFDKRESSEDPSSATESSTGNIPAPQISADGSAVQANLYPYPMAQPMKLFNRGQDGEHYGFYSYFDRSVLMQLPSANTSGSAVATTLSANAVCIWSQTRFLVQMWTRFGFLRSSAPNGTSSADDFSQSGSFDLPVTISIDRHGGDPDKKGVYCYGLDEHKHPLAHARFIVNEDRAFGGSTVNAAPTPFAASSVGPDKADGFGGSDGGTGGCKCVWATR